MGTDLTSCDNLNESRCQSSTDGRVRIRSHAVATHHTVMPRVRPGRPRQVSSRNVTSRPVCLTFKASPAHITHGTGMVSIGPWHTFYGKTPISHGSAYRPDDWQPGVLHVMSADISNTTSVTTLMHHPLNRWILLTPMPSPAPEITDPISRKV